MNIKLNDYAIAPQRMHGTDAGLDLYSPYDFEIEPRGRYMVGTGVCIELPKNTVGYIRSKSGLMLKKAILVDGTIDEGYTGQIGVIMFNLSNEKVQFKRGDKIAQLVVQPVLYPGMIVVEKLADSERGENGFGSTGDR